MAGANGSKDATADPGRRPFGGRSISALLSEIARAPEVDIGMAAARLRHEVRGSRVSRQCGRPLGEGHQDERVGLCQRLAVE